MFERCFFGVRTSGVLGCLAVLGCFGFLLWREISAVVSLVLGFGLDLVYWCLVWG